MTDVSTEALAFLDQHCAPMTARAIEHALRDYGVSRSQRAVIASALWRLNIITIKPKEQHHDQPDQ